MRLRQHLKAWLNHAALNAGTGVADTGRALQCLLHVFIPPQIGHTPETVESLAGSNPVREFLFGVGLVEPPPEPSAPYPPLQPGQRVLTVQPEVESSDWNPAAHQTRVWGVYGIVEGHHDSHGLVYRVRHRDNTVGCYEPRELVLV